MLQINHKYRHFCIALTLSKIQKRIYRLVLTINDPEENGRIGPFLQRNRVKFYLCFAPLPKVGLLQVNHQIWREATSFLYDNHFIMDGSDTSGQTTLPGFLKSIGRNRNLVRSIGLVSIALHVPEAYVEYPRAKVACEIFETLASLLYLRRIDITGMKFPWESFGRVP